MHVAVVAGFVVVGAGLVVIVVVAGIFGSADVVDVGVVVLVRVEVVVVGIFENVTMTMDSTKESLKEVDRLFAADTDEDNKKVVEDKDDKFINACGRPKIDAGTVKYRSGAVSRKSYGVSWETFYFAVNCVGQKIVQVKTKIEAVNEKN